MKVSVIIPIYNVAPYIASCLDSVYHQTHQNLEVILVDDCGTDNSMEIVNQYLTPDKLQITKIIHHEKNRGLSAARNTGIEYATGKYISFVDSDDTIALNAFSLMVELAEKNELQLVIGEYDTITKEATKYVKVDFEENIITDNKTILNHYTNLRWYILACNKLLRTDFIRENNLYFKEGYIFEDEFWNLMLVTKTQRMGVIREALYHYYIRPNSIMERNRGSLRWFGFLKILHLMKEYIIQENLYNHLNLGKFFLYKLIITLNGLRKFNALNYSFYKEVKKLNYINLNDLYRNKLITRNEYICYQHLGFPPYLDYLYFKCTELYYNFR